MEAKNIQFDIALDGLVYKCNAMPKTDNPVALYVLNIEIMDRIYRVDMQLDQLTKGYTLVGYSEDAPEIAELEFKISDALRNRYMQ